MATRFDTRRDVEGIQRNGPRKRRFDMAQLALRAPQRCDRRGFKRDPKRGERIAFFDLDAMGEERCRPASSF